MRSLLNIVGCFVIKAPGFEGANANVPPESRHHPSIALPWPIINISLQTVHNFLRCFADAGCHVTSNGGGNNTRIIALATLPPLKSPPALCQLHERWTNV